MNKVYDKLLKCYESVRQITDFKPEIAVVLGSGFGQYASEFKVETTISYRDIEGFPVSTVIGHAGEFIFGYIEKSVKMVAPVVVIPDTASNNASIGGI